MSELLGALLRWTGHRRDKYQERAIRLIYLCLTNAHRSGQIERAIQSAEECRPLQHGRLAGTPNQSQAKPKSSLVEMVDNIRYGLSLRFQLLATEKEPVPFPGTFAASFW